MLSSRLKTLPLFGGVIGDNVRVGFDPINTWDEFKRQLKRQLYLKDTENEVRTKPIHLQHKEGHVREYIKEFQELLLEIPSMAEQDVLYTDGSRRSIKDMVYKTSPL